MAVAVGGDTVQLLTSALEGRMGALLSDETVWEMVQTCFVNRNEIAHSRQLCHAAEQSLFRMMRVVFRKAHLSTQNNTGSSRGGSTTGSPAMTPPVSSINIREGANILGLITTTAELASGAPTSSPGRLQNIGGGHSHPHIGARPFGLPCAVKIFGFLCSQLLQGFHHQGNAGGAGHPYHVSLRLICLRMIREGEYIDL